MTVSPYALVLGRRYATTQGPDRNLAEGCPKPGLPPPGATAPRIQSWKSGHLGAPAWLSVHSSQPQGAGAKGLVSAHCRCLSGLVGSCRAGMWDEWAAEFSKMEAFYNPSKGNSSLSRGEYRKFWASHLGRQKHFKENQKPSPRSFSCCKRPKEEHGKSLEGESA